MKKKFRKLIAWTLMTSLCASMGMTAAYAEEADDVQPAEVIDADLMDIEKDLFVQLEQQMKIEEDSHVSETAADMPEALEVLDVPEETEDVITSETEEVSEEVAEPETEEVVEESETEDLSLAATAQTITMSQLNAPGVAVPQGADGDGSCLLSAITSLFRRTAYLSGDPGWSSITKNDTGVRWQMTVRGVTVVSEPFYGDVNTLVNLLNVHPEGVVIYCEGLQNNYGYSQHAVLLTDYTNKGLYAFEPIPTYYNKYGPRMSLMQTSLGRDCGSIAGIVAHITRIWYVQSPTGLTVQNDLIGQAPVAPAPSPNGSLDRTPVTGLKAEPAGNSMVKLTWNAHKGAQGYAIYGMKDGIYNRVGLTTGTTYTDKMALYSDYNYYWVFGYEKLPSGTVVMTDTGKYVFAKGICPAVTGLRAISGIGGVKLTWDKVKDAEGYLVYGIVNGTKYKYLGMTTTSTVYTDRTAGKSTWSFYWVYPYFHDGSGKMIVGNAPKYVYNKAK